MDIVLDKSFLCGARTEQVHNLCRESNVLMPESLFYEILATTPRDRAACFRKLPDVDNPVVLIPGVGALLKFEAANRVPCKPITQAAINLRYQFNQKLRNEEYILPRDQAKVLDEWQEEIRNDVQGFKERSARLYHWFPDLAQYRPGQKSSIVPAARDVIANDEKFVRKIYDEIRHPAFPESDLIGPAWTFFRWVQIHFLAAVEYIRRFGPGNTSQSAKQIEHDVLDIEYCVIGVQAGAIASRDNGIISMFKKVCPGGVLKAD